MKKISSVRNYKNISSWKYIVLTLFLLSLTGVILFFMGWEPICECGYIKFWQGEIFSSENSQHITDYYTFSHIIHGFAFYWIAWIFLKRLPIRKRFIAALIPEILWEIIENSSWIINKYREGTISLDYYGDSIINSLSDIMAMMLGFWLASKLPVWVTIVLTILMELVVGYLIRDNLTFNIIMLLYPLEQIRSWQSRG